MGHETMHPLSFHTAFKQSNFGEKASHIYRWLRFKPESMENTEWEHILGADINDISHMQLTYGLTRFFIHYNEFPSKSWKGKEVPQQAKFSQEEKDQIQILALVHDWPEAIVGDKAFIDKNESDLAREADLLHAMASSVFCFPDFNNPQRDTIQGISIYLNNKRTKIGRAFEVIEHLGYLRTCLRAECIAGELRQKKRPSPQEKELAKRLTDMGTTVKQSEIEWLTKNGAGYPAVTRFFEVWKINIDKV